jgi:hypothetical protein
MSLLLAVTAGGGPTFTLTASGGTYAFSGGDALFTFARSIIASGATYAYTGGAAIFAFGRTLTASGATYAFTGGDALFTFNRALVASGASYAFTGGAANFVQNRALIADGGTYAYSGGAALFNFTAGATFTLIASGGTYSYAGGDALFTKTVATDVTGGWPTFYPRRKRKLPETETPEETLEVATVALAKRQTLRQAEQRDQQITAQLRAIYAEQDALQSGIAQAEALAQDEEDIEAILLLVS